MHNSVCKTAYYTYLGIQCAVFSKEHPPRSGPGSERFIRISPWSLHISIEGDHKGIALVMVLYFNLLSSHLTPPPLSLLLLPLS